MVKATTIKFNTLCVQNVHTLKNKDCKRILNKDILDLINRQQAEIERLKDLLRRHQRNTNRIRMITAETAKKIKADAVKEFAERYEKYLLSQLTSATLEKKEVICFCLDELKEMVGEG